MGRSFWVILVGENVEWNGEGEAPPLATCDDIENTEPLVSTRNRHPTYYDILLGRPAHRSFSASPSSRLTSCLLSPEGGEPGQQGDLHVRREVGAVHGQVGLALGHLPQHGPPQDRQGTPSPVDIPMSTRLVWCCWRVHPLLVCVC